MASAWGDGEAGPYKARWAQRIASAVELPGLVAWAEGHVAELHQIEPENLGWHVENLAPAEPSVYLTEGEP